MSFASRWPPRLASLQVVIALAGVGVAFALLGDAPAPAPAAAVTTPAARASTLPASVAPAATETATIRLTLDDPALLARLEGIGARALQRATAPALADVVAIIGSTDIVIGETDR